MKLILLILIFLFLGAFFIVSNNNLALSKGENRDKFLFLCKSWIGDVGENFKSITGYAIKLDWLPK